MKDTHYFVDKLMRMAAQFDVLYENKEYTRAAYVYRKASIIAVFLELPERQMSELFGYYPDDGNPESVPPEGLFKIERVRRVNWECCVRQHKTYQDEACRRTGEPQRFYSDAEYCSLKCLNASWEHTKQISELTK